MNQDILIALALSMTINFMQIAMTCYLMFAYKLKKDRKEKQK